MKSGTKKIAIAAGVVVALAVIGTVVGVVVTENNKKNNNSSSNSSSGSHTDANGHVASTTGSNAPSPSPSSITLDPALHKSFYGIAYTPKGAILPECGAKQDEVTQDIAKLSQLTSRVRLYGSDCNVTSFVLQAIQDLQVDVKVYAGIYLEEEETSYTRQKTILENALAAYGTKNVLGVTVGNEYVLVEGNAGVSAETAAARVASKMTEVRTDLTALGYNLPVGTSDTGGTTTQTMADAADYIFANIHPWFSGNTIDGAVTYANNAFTAVEAMGKASPRNPEIWQGEYGWPSASDTADSATNAGGSPAGIKQLQQALDDWVCAANTAGTKYFWFSAFDEAWKAVNGGVEAHWGLFDTEGKLKDLTLPTCASP